MLVFTLKQAEEEGEGGGGIARRCLANTAAMRRFFFISCCPPRLPVGLKTLLFRAVFPLRVGCFSFLKDKTFVFRREIRRHSSNLRPITVSEFVIRS